AAQLRRLFERADGGPHGTLDLLHLAGSEAVRRVAMSDVAAIANQLSAPDLPERSAAFGTREPSRRAVDAALVKCVRAVLRDVLARVSRARRVLAAFAG